MKSKGEEKKESVRGREGRRERGGRDLKAFIHWLRLGCV